jgi:release factor glutamine methyltransferase
MRSALFSIKDLLHHGTGILQKSSETARLDAEVLLASLVESGSKELFYKNPDQILAPATVTEFNRLLSRRKNFEPISYIVGKKEFWSLEFKVNRSVLIPRPETEILVEVALHRVADLLNTQKPVRIADIGTGSGAICLSLAHELKNEAVEMVAIDNSKKALATAQTNSVHHHLKHRVKFSLGDLYIPLPPLSQNLIVSNPPYIKREQLQFLPPHIKNYEPLSALDGGIDGLYHIRKLVEAAWVYLLPKGELLIEIGHSQLDKVMKMILDNGHYSNVKFYRDLAEIPRVIHCQKIKGA